MELWSTVPVVPAASQKLGRASLLPVLAPPARSQCAHYDFHSMTTMTILVQAKEPEPDRQVQTWKRLLLHNNLEE